jgi:predicted acylesterase/phospholipase RssA
MDKKEYNEEETNEITSEEINIETKKNINKIEHLVLSGGAYLGLYEYGALKYLSNEGFIDIENIKSIHGTSIGGLLSVILSLKIDWTHLTEYFIKRPWYKMIQLNPNMFFDVIPNKGLLGKPFFISLCKPLFETVDISLDITLKELYDKTNIELYLYSVNLNTYLIEQLSYKKYPELKVIDAIHMTCALPYIFQPVWYNNSFYIDGSLINNYPIDFCIMQQLETNKDNILGIKLETHNKNNNVIRENINIFEYGYLLYKQMSKSIKNNTTHKIKYELIIPTEEVNMKEGYDIIMDENKRKEYIEAGEKFANVFLSYNS